MLYFKKDAGLFNLGIDKKVDIRIVANPGLVLKVELACSRHKVGRFVGGIKKYIKTHSQQQSFFYNVTFKIHAMAQYKIG